MARGSQAQQVPLERLVLLVSRLSQAQGRPVDADELLAMLAYGAEHVQDQRDQLRRDVRHLQAQGWDITNVGGAGDTAAYRMASVDNRLRVELSPEQRFELWRVARIASLPGFSDELRADELRADELRADELRAEVAPDHGTGDSVRAEDAFAPADVAALAALDPVSWARDHHCLLHFRYHGTDRAAHPYRLFTTAGGWYLQARLEGEVEPKNFLLARMSEVWHDDPGTAEAPPAVATQLDLDPVRWRLDPPVEALVETTEQHRDRVRALLGDPLRVEPDRDAARPQDERAGTRDEPVVLTIEVTSREAFLSRLCQLGTRARLLGPPELRSQLRDRLESVVAAGGGP